MTRSVCALFLFVVISTFCLVSAVSVNCRKQIYHPTCRGISAMKKSNIPSPVMERSVESERPYSVEEMRELLWPRKAGGNSKDIPNQNTYVLDIRGKLERVYKLNDDNWKEYVLDSD